MAGRIKKIHYVKGKIFKEKSVPNKSLLIAPDEFIWFEAEWTKEATAKQKQQDIQWLWQEQESKAVLKKTAVNAQLLYGVKIPKKLCGFKYYLDASHDGNRIFSKPALTGLAIVGYCPPRITASKWCVSSDGTAAGKQKQFAYGERVYLNLDTEGINGVRNVTIEIYAHKTMLPDPLTRTIVGVEVMDGEINVEINNTISWYGKHMFPKEVMEFYVKVKLSNGNYVIDANGDDIHARFLRIKPEQKHQNPEPPKNTTALKVGSNAVNLKNYHACKLNKIQLTETGETFAIFEDGKTHLVKQRSTLRRVKQTVHFEYDRYDLRDDAKKIMDILLDFLLYNPFLDMMLEGHADDRGSFDYNQTLSEKRADSVKNYFVQKGLKDERIKTRGFGEARDAVKATTEAQHSKNRRTVIEFSYYEYDSNAIIYQTLAGSALKEKRIDLALVGHDTRMCMRDHDKHKKEIEIINKDEKGIVPGSQAKMKVTSTVPANFAPHFLLYLAQYLIPKLTLSNPYTINTHTCAYFADKTYPTLQMLVYPDLVWIANLQYNFEEKGDYFFHDKKLELEQGIELVLKKFKESTFYKMLSILPDDWVTNTEDKIEENVIVKYLYEETKKFLYGAHVIHDRDIEKAGDALVLKGKEVNLITQTEYTKYAAALGVLYLVTLGIVIELVIIYLTRGRNLKGKIRKIAKKAKKVKKILDKYGLEINPASIAIYAGMYYYQQWDKRVAVVYEAGIKADPLLEINCEQEFDLVDMLQTSNNEITGKKKKSQVVKDNTAEVLDILSKAKIISVKGKVTITANIACDIKVKFNSLTQEYDIIDNLGNFVNTAKQEVVFKEQVQVELIIKGDLEHEFEFYGIESKLEAHIAVKMNGAAALKTHFAVGVGVGFYMEKTLLFSGIKGTFTGNVKGKARVGDEEYEEEYKPNNGKPIPFTLIDPYEITLGRIHLFNPNEK
ncbi:MAG: OmpA family protein [Limnohabitans sp.]|nr:OmpA family protein [Limnohabitans sp.]